MTASVACIVPVHNGERYLAETLRSILAQTRRPTEVGGGRWLHRRQRSHCPSVR
jgi:hypothetical protein